MSRLLSVALVIFVALAGVLSPAPVAAGENTTPKVAVIVGPVGPNLTPHYLRWAEWTATAAEEAGAVVERAYSPDATAENVLAAVADANIIVYYGHGWGSPSPYAPNASKQNGWALNGPNSRDHSDSTRAGTMVYYGADWLRANAKPAPGFVMVYAHTCYAPGAGDAPAGESTPAEALERTTNFSAPIFDLGASAFYAVDFFRGAEGFVSRMLANREATYGDIFSADPRFYRAGLVDNELPSRPDGHIWQQRSTMVISPEHTTDGNGGRRTDYFMAFAGNPEATPAATWNVTYDSEPPVITRVRPARHDRHVAADATIKVTFDEDVVGANAVNFILNDVTDMPAKFTNVPVKVTYDAETFTVSVDPLAELEADHTYELWVRDAMADAIGHTMERPYWWQFTVDGTAPKFERSYPESMQLFPVHHDLRVFGNEPLKLGDTEALTLVETRSSTAVEFTTRTGADGELIIDPVEPLAFDARYILRADEGAVTDLANNPLEAFTRTFETDAATSAESFLPRALAPGEIAADTADEVDVEGILNPEGDPVLVTSRGSIAERPGYWFTSGDHLIAESESAYLPGLVGRSAVWSRPSSVERAMVTIPAGNHVGVVVDADGAVSEGERANLDAPTSATVSERAWINGRPHLLIRDGIWAGQWLPEAGMMLSLPDLPSPTTPLSLME